MKLEQQVANLELSQKLDSLGVKGESLFYHIKDESEKIDRIHPAGEIIQEYEVDEEYGSSYPTPEDVLTNESWSDYKENSIIVSAYTVAELGEMLPREIDLPYKNGKSRGRAHRRIYGEYGAGLPFYCYYYCTSRSSNLEERADTEADARAKMLIHLLENKLIKPPCNP